MIYLSLKPHAFPMISEKTIVWLNTHQSQCASVVALQSSQLALMLQLLLTIDLSFMFELPQSVLTNLQFTTHLFHFVLQFPTTTLTLVSRTLGRPAAQSSKNSAIECWILLTVCELCTHLSTSHLVIPNRTWTTYKDQNGNQTEFRCIHSHAALCPNMTLREIFRWQYWRSNYCFNV